MARPSKFTDTRCRIILDALADGQTYQVAATMAGVSAGTLSGWLKDEEKLEFFEKCKAAEAQAEAKLVACVHDHAGSDWKAAKWLLARRYNHWREVPIQDQQIADELNKLKVLKAQVELEYAQSKLEMLRSQDAEDVSLLAILNEPAAIEHTEEANESRPANEKSSTTNAEETGQRSDGQGDGSVSQPDAR
jgi:hypothetical protein